VLVGDRAPAPDRHRLARQGARAPLLARVDLPGQNAAAVAPVIAEVKGESELFAGLELLRRLQLVLVLSAQLRREIIARKADPAAIGELKVMKMGKIPAPEGLVD
jgi:hypothetical protein